jgi:hypothetical protein
VLGPMVRAPSLPPSIQRTEQSVREHDSRS